MIKKILISLGALVALLLIVGFFLPGKIEVSKSMTVNAPAEYAFEEVNTLPNWNRWSYWNTLDTAMTITYTEQKSGPGASYSWESEDMGPGKLSITESVPYTLVKADLDFMENGTAKAWYDFAPEGDGTKVTMSFSSDFGMNPISRWFGVLMLRSEMEKSFHYNLTKIKELAEAKPKFSVAISQEVVPAISYVGIAHKMSPKDMNAVSIQMGKMYGELSAALAKAKVQPTGMPFCIYPSYSAESMEMVCALPVAQDTKVSSKYPVTQIATGSVVKGIHVGPYDKLEATHNEINRYVEFKNLEISGAPWEVYVTDPGKESDPAKWITEIYYPVNSKEI